MLVCKLWYETGSRMFYGKTPFYYGTPCGIKKTLDTLPLKVQSAITSVAIIWPLRPLEFNALKCWASLQSLQMWVHFRRRHNAKAILCLISKLDRLTFVTLYCELHEREGILPMRGPCKDCIALQAVVDKAM